MFCVGNAVPNFPDVKSTACFCRQHFACLSFMGIKLMKFFKILPGTSVEKRQNLWNFSYKLKCNRHLLATYCECKSWLLVSLPLLYVKVGFVRRRQIKKKTTRPSAICGWWDCSCRLKVAVRVPKRDYRKWDLILLQITNGLFEKLYYMVVLTYLPFGVCGM